jgi:hypothetical protein
MSEHIIHNILTPYDLATLSGRDGGPPRRDTREKARALRKKRAKDKKRHQR